MMRKVMRQASRCMMNDDMMQSTNGKDVSGPVFE